MLVSATALNDIRAAADCDSELRKFSVRGLGRGTYSVDVLLPAGRSRHLFPTCGSVLGTSSRSSPESVALVSAGELNDVRTAADCNLAFLKFSISCRGPSQLASSLPSSEPPGTHNQPILVNRLWSTNRLHSYSQSTGHCSSVSGYSWCQLVGDSRVFEGGRKNQIGDSVSRLQAFLPASA